MGYSIAFQERALHDYFIPRHRKYSGQHHATPARRMMGRLDAYRQNNIQYNIMDFQYSDWLYCIWNNNFLFLLLPLSLRKPQFTDFGMRIEWGGGCSSKEHCSGEGREGIQLRGNATLQLRHSHRPSDHTDTFVFSSMVLPPSRATIPLLRR